MRPRPLIKRLPYSGALSNWKPFGRGVNKSKPSWHLRTQPKFYKQRKNLRRYKSEEGESLETLITKIVRDMAQKTKTINSINRA